MKNERYLLDVSVAEATTFHFAGGWLLCWWFLAMSTAAFNPRL